jgi:hypothetical protein
MPPSKRFTDNSVLVHAGEQGNLVVVVRDKAMASIEVGVAVGQVLEARYVVVSDAIGPSDELTALKT